MKKFICNYYILVFYITGTFLYSQSASISGTVKDILNGDALIGANVFIQETSLGAATTDNGQYQINNVNLGTYTVKVSYIGYQSKEVEITLSEAKNYVQDFNLAYTTVEGKTVLVTAQAKGQMDAINRQLKAKSIKNIVSSDRIQELPDANVAESVARIPGVSIRREGGEGNKVVIRGLSPQYNKVTVNGTNLASTDPDNRSTDLSMISQYMLDGIEVTKAGTPDQEGDVLGGTVNFILKKAAPGFHGSLVTQGMHNGLKNTNDDNKIVMSLSNRFFNDRIGILGQIDSENRNRSSHNLGASYVNAPAELDSLNALSFQGLTLTDMARLNDRTNTLFVLDAKIPFGTISYSGLNSKIDKEEISYADNYALLSEIRHYNTGQTNSKINVITETWKYEISLPNLKLDFFKSYSLSKNDRTSILYNFRERYAYTENVNNKSLETIQNFLVNDKSGAFYDRYDYNEYFTDESESSSGANLQFDFNLKNKVSGKIKMGIKVRNKKRTHDRDSEYSAFTYVAIQDKRDSTIKSFDWLDEYADPGDWYITYRAFWDPDYDAGNFLNGDYEIGPAADLDKMNALFHWYRNDAHFTDASYHEEIMHHYHKTNSMIFDYSGKENYDGKYIMADMNIGSKLNLLTGIRWEDNITTYRSFKGMQNTLPHYNAAGSDTVSIHTRENFYSLPSLFLKYEPNNWLILRYASTKTLTRPDYADIIPLYNFLGLGGEVLYRNRFLEPGVSKNQDYVVAFNSKKLGLLSLSYFTKNIDGMVYSSGKRYIVEGTADSLYGLPHYTDKKFIVDYKLNNPYAVKLEGFEIDYQTRFWYLPGMLSGLVFNANYTRSLSEVKYPRTTIDYQITWVPSFQIVTVNLDSFYVDRLIDQPNDIFNYSLGYDYRGFSARVSMLYMSDVFKTTNFWPELRETTDSYRRYDLSMKQKLPVKGLEIYLNISNLTEAIDVTRLRGYNQSDPNFDHALLDKISAPDDITIDERLDMIPTDSRAKKLEEHYGKTIDLGFRFSF
ncbi:MAG: carboxypeptidase-like regulatory domain-containing protein [Candidatus Neomarinimicrobiota bacterium]|nr:carboxypeptidase-like regulatory domain-containing protein [Candidatus Neomarinimicrobiota bacterium]|tara:strand:- start:1 stop:3030 length:3030 start_codon:yes stop_codon:yes gene_type:complete